MAPHIRPLTEHDADDVLRINEASVHHLAPMGPDELTWFLVHAACAWGVEVDDELAGFVLVLPPGLDYASDNYRWFSARYDRFTYLDRVALDERHRRQGIGSVLYDAVEAEAHGRGGPLLLEVNVRPANEASLAFHDARGYVEVGTLAHDGGAKVVRLLELAPPT